VVCCSVNRPTSPTVCQQEDGCTVCRQEDGCTEWWCAAALHDPSEPTCHHHTSGVLSATGAEHVAGSPTLHSSTSYAAKSLAAPEGRGGSSNLTPEGVMSSTGSTERELLPSVSTTFSEVFVASLPHPPPFAMTIPPCGTGDDTQFTVNVADACRGRTARKIALTRPERDDMAPVPMQLASTRESQQDIIISLALRKRET
jgi:hypothetical protein